MTENNRPQVGVSLLVVDETEHGIYVLLGKRLGSLGKGQWRTPGGHQENGESYEETALRELREECGSGLEAGRPRFLCVTNLMTYLPKHYTDIGMIIRYRSGSPELMEPEKCDGWQWFRIDSLPVPRFATVDSLVIAYHTGQVYFPDADS